MTFQIAFSCFSSDSPEFLHVSLNSFRKHCSNVLSAALCLVAIISDYRQDFHFIRKQSAKQWIVMEQCLLKEFKATCKNSNGLFQKKSTPPRRMGFWKFSREGGQRLWKSRRERGVELKKVFWRGHFDR